MWLGASPLDEAAFIEGFEDRTRGTIAIENDGRVIGDLMVRVEDGWAQRSMEHLAAGCQAALGWVMSPDATGRGFATEAVRAAIDLCFGPLGLRRVHAGCFADNEPSWRLMERLGMRREEFSRATALHMSGEWLDTMVYAVLAEEWPTNREARRTTA